ncbi:uncharacterized protein M421DRAFT_99513 [Didymella exigua CBS 183.55]|uniref:Uncharacterized protein n=1 Tax=Didymella exigua CBS 183.55 TaxID=1150837 RepID=A0A6A5RUW8_9PLEO|nr:uncharacterized protein M421DRAFT_99513 [Didymella exigua CBS 183.55]KAF1930954.1 hypothetical protein M421DRAFT_99513 [Didymella exigua CBS 183.55]
MVRYERSAGMNALMDQGPGLLSPRSASESQPSPSPTRPGSPRDDEAETYNAGDIAMENIYASPLSSPDDFTRGDKRGHRSRHPHTKRFDHNQARKYLFKVGGLKLLTTILFSALICVTLKSWEGFHETIVLSKMEIKIFNALMIGLSLCLGLNLLASLQNYAGILRWSLLSRRYVSLETFDLMLGLERLSNVFKLMVISLPLVRRHKYLRKFRWLKDARQDDTKWTWVVCLVWLGINVGSQVLVAVSSLFYPMDPSMIPLLTHGNVTVANLAHWHPTPEAEEDGQSLNRQEAWLYGMEAIAYPQFAPDDIQQDLSILPGPPLYQLANGSYEYRFFNRNPVHQYSHYLLSSRSIITSATCDQLEVRDSEEGEFYIDGRHPNTDDWTTFVIPQYAGGAFTWIADVRTEFCGPRCTNFTVLQPLLNTTNSNVTKTSLFLCNSTVEEMTMGHNKHDITNLSRADYEFICGSDDWAKIASGSLGWTGIYEEGWDKTQFRTYTQGSKWSPNRNMDVAGVQDILMRFTIGAIAAFDDHGPRYNVMNQNVLPIPGQQLNVDWSYLLSILGGICGIQLIALCCLLIFANRTIVRDESYFSVAMLLSPVIGRLGSEGGMNMSGEEIKHHPKLQFKKIQYSYHEGKNGNPNQVDILWEGRDSRESRKSWAAGVYN